VSGNGVKAFGVIGSPKYPTDPAQVAERTGRAYDRSFDPLGAARQAVAVLASGDFTPKLRELDLATLVIHGDADPLVSISGARATAEAIRVAKLVVVAGMAPDLPKPLWSSFAAEIQQVTK